MKRMNKVLITIITLACVVFFTYIPAFAANGTVSDLKASGTSSVSVSGKTSGVLAAVFVQVLDADGNVIASSSFKCPGGQFLGTIDANLESGKTYTVKAADYDGGDWATTTFTVASSSGGNSGGSSGGGNSGSGNNGNSGGTATVVPLKTGGDGSLRTGESHGILIAFIVAMTALTAGAAAYVLITKRKKAGEAE